MLIKKLNLAIVLSLLIVNCTPAQNQDQGKINRIRIIYSTWDRRSSIIMGVDSSIVQQGIVSAEDSSITNKAIVGARAMTYIGKYIYSNSKDSVSSKHLDGSDYLVRVIVHSERDTLDFYIQYKQSNNFLEKLTNKIKMSPYNEECLSVLHFLEIYNRLDKEGQL